MDGAAIQAPPGERLRAKLSLAGTPLRRRLAGFWAAGDFTARYPALLRELFVISRGGIPLMEAARDEARRREGPAAGIVASYLARHVEEERGHCEWVLDDLAALGYDRAEEARRPLTFRAAALLGCGYAWTFETHPAAILGFLAVFEGDPMTVPFLQEVAARHGLPEAAFGFYLDHARIDPRHSAEIFGAIDDAVAAEPGLESPIALCALHALQLTDELLKDLAGGATKA